MTRQFYYKHTSDFFVDKKAQMTKTISNRMGHQIKEGEVVTIRSKSRGFWVVSDSGVRIRNVDCDDLDLIDTQS